MKRFAYSLVGALALTALVGACASTQQQGLDLVTRGVQASGGPVTLGGVKTISEKGTVKQWDPEQSAAAGGEMRRSLALISTLASISAGSTSCSGRSLASVRVRVIC